MLYLPAFDLLSERMPDLGTLTLATGGETDIVIDFAALTGPTTLASPDDTSHVFFHWTSLEAGGIYIRATDRSGELRRQDISYYGFEQALTVYVNAQGWAGTFAILLDLGTGFVTAAYDGGDFTMTWSTDAGRALCGFATDQSGDDTYTGTVVPMYCVKPVRRAVSRPTRKMRERGAISAVRADGGGGSSLGRYVTNQRIRFFHQYESPAKVELELARPAPADWSDSLHPTAIEDVFDQAQSGLPFILYAGGLGYGQDGVCLSLTSDAAFEPEGSSADRMNVAALHVSFDCYVEGRVAAS